MTNSKIITYVLSNKERNYNDLYIYLESFSTWAHINESVWFVKSEKSCDEIVDDLYELTYSDDSVFVATLSGDAAYRNIMCEIEFLKHNL